MRILKSEIDGKNKIKKKNWQEIKIHFFEKSFCKQGYRNEKDPNFFLLIKESKTEGSNHASTRSFNHAKFSAINL